MGIFTMAGGDYATAMGRDTKAGGDYATAMGNSTTASGNYATAMGRGTEAGGDYATAMGYSTTASGNYATAMGRGTEASSIYATAMGDNTTASGFRAMAMGWLTKAIGGVSTAMGFNSTARGDHSTAMGDNTLSWGNSSTAMGFDTIAKAFASVVLGQYNIIQGDTTTWVSTDPVLVVGNGSDFSTRSNAFTLLKDGNLTIAGTLTQSSDRRLKTDIHPLTDALDGLARLQPVRFRFREGMSRPEGTHIGLIAQEVQAVFPELVQQGADGYLSVSYTNLSAVLVQALNEQQAEVEALRAEIASLRTANITMQDRLARLEAVSH